MIETRMATTSNYGFDLIDCDQDPEMLFGEYAKKDKENWQKTDTVIKNVENKVDKVKSEAGNLVTLDGESKQNFNFTLSSKGNSVSGLKVSTTIAQIPKLYKESKTLRGTWTEIPYTETRDLANYNYKFM